jgi:hypothetical protein
MVEEIRRDWDGATGDRRQEVVFIGIEMPRDRMLAELDACLLTPEEMAAGDGVWRQMEDPFPQMEMEPIQAP